MEVKCSNCGCINNLDLSDLSWDSEPIDERNMGSEIEWDSSIPKECDNCGEKMALNIKIWEYPPLIYNSHELEYINCEEVEDLRFDEFDMPFQDIEEDDEEEEDEDDDEEEDDDEDEG